MTRLSLSRAWDETRERIRRDGNLFLSVALALLVLPQTVAGLLAPPAQLAGEEPSAGANLLMFIAAIIGLMGQLALVRLATRPATSVGEAIGHGARRVLPTLLALMLFGLALAIIATPLIILFIAAGWVDAASISANPAAAGGGFAALIMLLGLIALLISVRLSVTVPVSSAEAPGIVQILRRSWALTQGHFWRLFAFLVLILIAALAILAVASIFGGIVARLASGEVTPMSLGALLLALITAIAQALFTILTTVMLARIYVQLAGAGEAETSVPSSGI